MDKPIAYGYTRISRVRKDVPSLGIAAQTDTIQRYCEWKGFEIKNWYTDSNISGNVPIANRQGTAGQGGGGAQLSADVQPGQHVIFAKLDRGFRNAIDCYQTIKLWRDRGITAHFCDLQIDTSNAMGELVLKIMVAVAEWERLRISERTREAKAIQRANGIMTTPNQVPFGWKMRKDRRGVEPHKENLWLLKVMWEWRERGLTFMDVSRSMAYSFRYCPRCLIGDTSCRSAADKSPNCPGCGVPMYRFKQLLDDKSLARMLQYYANYLDHQHPYPKESTNGHTSTQTQTPIQR